MLKTTVLALAGAAAVTLGAAIPVSTAQAGSTAYAPSYYNQYGGGHHNKHRYSQRRNHCRWVQHPVRYKTWHPWRGWVWHTTWQNKRVCY